MEHLEQNQNITVNCCRKQKEFYEIPRSERMTCIHSLEEYRLISNEEYFARFGEIEAALEEIRSCGAGVRTCRLHRDWYSAAWSGQENYTHWWIPGMCIA